MTTLVWDETGEKKYQAGVDRGVLYLHDGTVAAWNGLISVEESSVGELKSYYLEGRKFLETLVADDFQGKLKAYTYPDEFDAVNGIIDFSPGFSLYNQPTQSFDMTYRTLVGNDVLGTKYGYKIHILYNVLANPDTNTYQTLSGSDVNPVEFVWDLTGTPPHIKGFRPTVHISVDSTQIPEEILSILERTLYGSSTTSPSLPPITEIAELFGYRGALIIIDHGDGSWTAIDEEDTYIDMTDSTTFSIKNADTTIIDPDTYTISSTNVDVGD